MVSPVFVLSIVVRESAIGRGGGGASSSLRERRRCRGSVADSEAASRRVTLAMARM